MSTNNRLKFSGVTPVDASTMEGSFGEDFHTAAVAANGSLDQPLLYVDTKRPNLTLESVNFTPSAASATNGTNYVTISIINRKTGSGTDVVATLNTSSVSLTANVRAALVIDRTKLINSGDLLSYVVAQTASGVALAPGLLEVDFVQ